MEESLSEALGLISGVPAQESAIEQGLDQIQELLSDLCRTKADDARRTLTAQLHGRPELKELLALQDSFIYNIASRTVPVLPILRGEVLIKALTILEGVCLLHFPSRHIFAQKSSMDQLIKILSSKDPEVIIATINVLPAVMVREPANIRIFEECGGLAVIAKLLKDKESAKTVKLRILEFLFFYLIPETKHPDKRGRKTTDQKAKLLSQHLTNVNGLVRELHTTKPFGELDLEW